MTPDQEERLVVAFEHAARALDEIAASVDLIAMTTDARFAKEHPEKPEPRPMTISRVPTEEDLIREAHGGEDALRDARDPLDKWTTLGTREAKWESAHEKAAKDAPDDPPPPAGPDSGEVPD